ncbi:MAG: hypothetical protein KY475_00925 [Planctomycetes bacterium]|nr:hypothetical protein [Planctomycetota bacterium]
MVMQRSAAKQTFAAIVGAVILAATAAGQEFRTWTDASGRFSLTAKLVSRDGDRLTLEREGGAKVAIAVSQLSQADQDYLAKMSSASPFQPVEESPFQSVPETPQPAAPAGGGPKIVTVDWSQSEAVVMEAAQQGWEVTPPAPAAAFKAKSVPLPQKKDFFEKFSRMAVNPLARKAVLGYTLKSESRILLCDLQAGRVLAEASAEGEMAPLAVHDNGQYIVMRRNEFGFGKHDRLEIWSIRGKEVARHLIWTPYDDARGADRDVMWAEFIDATTLATASRGGKVALWNVGTAAPICHFQLVGGAVPALSEDRRWIAFASDSKVGLFDVQKREIAVLSETPTKLTWPYVAFSPEGTQLACTAQDRILVWDTATGELKRNFNTPGIHIHGAIDFPDENFLLANNQYLIALDSQIKLWQYHDVGHVQTKGGNTFIPQSPHNRPGTLLAVKVPHAEAVSLLQKALTQPDLFVFREGSAVTLDVSGVPDSHREQVAKSLTAKLQEMNCKVGPGGTITLAAKVEGPKQRTVSYHRSGDHQVQEYRTRLTFIYQGKPAWETSGTNIPGIITLRKGENVGGVLQKASQGPAYGFYDRVVLPKFLQKPADNQGPGGGQTLGSSRVTPDGLK